MLYLIPHTTSIFWCRVRRRYELVRTRPTRKNNTSSGSNIPKLGLNVFYAYKFSCMSIPASSSVILSTNDVVSCSTLLHLRCLPSMSSLISLLFHIRQRHVIPIFLFVFEFNFDSFRTRHSSTNGVSFGVHFTCRARHSFFCCVWLTSCDLSCRIYLASKMT